MNILVDSNIIIYAISSSAPKNKIAQDFLLNQPGRLMVAHQNILEALRILTHPTYIRTMTMAEAIAAVGRITSVMRIITPDLETNIVLMEFLQKYDIKSNAIFDCYLVATALSAGVTTIATDNSKDFQKYDEIKLLNPFKV